MYLRQGYTHVDYQEVTRKIVDHKCQLPLREDNLLQYYIREGLWVDYRRHFRRLFLLDKNHPYCKMKMRSTAMMEHEIGKHLREFYYTIHPYSKMRFWWEMVMIIIYATHFLIIPVALLDLSLSDEMTVLRHVVGVFNMVDIVLWFFTGYFDEKKQKIELRHKKIVKRYLMTFFLVDLLPIVVPITQSIVPMTNENQKMFFYLSFLLILKMFRFMTFNRYVDLFTVKVHLKNVLGKGIKFGCWYLIMLAWLVAYVGLLQHLMGGLLFMEDTDISDLIKKALFVADGIFLVGYDVNNLESPPEWYTCIIIIILIYLGSILNIIILSKVMQLIRMKVNAQARVKELNKEITEYMKYKALSPFLRQKIRRFIKFKFQNTVMREHELWKSLNRLLKEDILLNNCRDLIKKVEFFKDLPMHVLLRIITKLRSEIYLPNDVVVAAGNVGNAMYFIYIGSVAVYTSTYTEICHLKEGDHFGEISLLRMEPRTATVAAVTDCELLKLNRRDFHEAIEPYPELKDKIQQLATDRMQKTMRITSMSSSKQDDFLGGKFSQSSRDQH